MIRIIIFILTHGVCDDCRNLGRGGSRISPMGDLKRKYVGNPLQLAVPFIHKMCPWANFK